MHKTNVAGAALIAGGAALVGAMSGWELGPYRVDLTRDQLAIVGSVISGFVALAGCCLAMERSEARAKSRAAMRRLKWILFRTKKPGGSDLFSSSGKVPLQPGSSPAVAGNDGVAQYSPTGA